MERKLFLIAMVFLFVGCNGNREKESAERTVKVYTVENSGEIKQVSFPGKVKASSDINLAFRVSGPIQKIHVDVGKMVKKGQVLAEIDSRDYAIQLAATEAEYNQVKNESKRIFELFEKGTVTPNDYDKARFGLQQIEAKLNAHRNALKDTRLIAPCNGYIQKRLFEAGETVSAGLPILAMVSAEKGEVEINIPSSDYIRQNDFEHYSCSVDLFPDKLFPLELIGITHKANASQLYTARFRFVGNDKDIPSAGMSTMVNIQYKSQKNQLLEIPLSAVFYTQNQVKVWVYNPENQTISSRPIVIEKIHTNGVVIVSQGLESGEVILSAGVHSVKEGDKVKLLSEVSPTNIGGML